MRVVIALGGNALLKRGEPMTAEVQRRNIRTAPFLKRALPWNWFGDGSAVDSLATAYAAAAESRPTPRASSTSIWME